MECTPIDIIPLHLAPSSSATHPYHQRHHDPHDALHQCNIGAFALGVDLEGFVFEDHEQNRIDRTVFDVLNRHIKTSNAYRAYHAHVFTGAMVSHPMHYHEQHYAIPILSAQATPLSTPTLAGYTSQSTQRIYHNFKHWTLDEWLDHNRRLFEMQFFNTYRIIGELSDPTISHAFHVYRSIVEEYEERAEKAQMSYESYVFGSIEASLCNDVVKRAYNRHEWMTYFKRNITHLKELSQTLSFHLPKGSLQFLDEGLKLFTHVYHELVRLWGYQRLDDAS